MNATEIADRLAEPFDITEVKFKPGVVSGNRALAIAYVDARVIQDRLDDVLGVDGWQDDYECLSDGSVLCRLRLRFGPEWIVKVDLGGQSEQPDGGDRLKAAFSDALKRAAVKFGIGRYLYRLPVQWCDYDPPKKRFVNTPGLPSWALPKKNGNGRSGQESQPADKVKTSAKNGAPPNPMPKNGAELLERLTKASEGTAIVEQVRMLGLEEGWSDDIGTWDNPEQIKQVIGWVKDYKYRAANGWISLFQERELVRDIRARKIDEEFFIDTARTSYQIRSLSELPECHLQAVRKELNQWPTNLPKAKSK
jgi:hypothetical protein